MKHLVSLVGLIHILSASGLFAAAPRTDGPWTSLFDGRSIEGWVQRGGKAEYRVEDGVIIGRSVPNTGNSFLCTKRDYTNFVLELEFKVDAGLNPGVQIRSHGFDQATSFNWKGRDYKVAAGRVHGLQVEIDPSTRAWTAGVYEEGARGWMNDLKTNDTARAAFRQEDWNRLRIECAGDSIKTWLNGVAAAELNDGMTPAGFLGLQVHGVGDRAQPLEIRWRGLRLQELP